MKQGRKTQCFLRALVTWLAAMVVMTVCAGPAFALECDVSQLYGGFHGVTEIIDIYLNGMGNAKYDPVYIPENYELTAKDEWQDVIIRIQDTHGNDGYVVVHPRSDNATHVWTTDKRYQVIGATDSGSFTLILKEAGLPDDFTFPTGGDLDYTGSEQNLLTPGSISSNWRLDYAVGDEELCSDVPHRKDPGTYTVRWCFSGPYRSRIYSKDIKIRAINPLSFANTTMVVPYSASNEVRAALQGVKNAQGNVTYEITSQPNGNYFSISGNKLIVRAGTPVGEYSVGVRATAAGNSEYSRGSKDATVTVRVTNDEYPVWVGGSAISVSNTSGTGWSYDAENNTLTLNNYSYNAEGYLGAAIYAVGNLNIVLNGASKAASTAYGIYVQGDLSITGEGSLEARSSQYGIYTDGGDITINGGTVTAPGANAKPGIRSDGGSVLITGGKVTASTTGKNGSALSASKKVKISGGEVDAQNEGDLSTAGYGILDGTGTEVTGGKVYAYGLYGCIYSGNLTIGKGMVGTGWEILGQQVDVTDKYEICIKLRIEPHVHSFTYAAGTDDEANTITATCSKAHCTLDAGTVTLTIIANNASYDGAAHGASLDSEAWAAAGFAVPTIQYSGRGSTTYSDIAAPAAMGDYTASVTFQGKTAHVDYCIKDKQDVQGVSLTPSLTLAKGATYRLKALFTPADTDTLAVDRTAIWKSDKPEIATVNGNGVVTGVATGTATITVTATNGTADTADDKTATCTVKVAEPCPVWVGGVQATNEPLSVEDWGWSYDPTSKTLTLKNYTYTGGGYNKSAIYAEGDLKIVLKGKNSVTCTAPTVERAYGIHVKGKLTIEGDGSLSASGPSFGLYNSGGNMTINGGAVTATTTTNNIAAIRSENDSVLINGGTVTASASARAISAKYDIQIKGGKVQAQATGTGGDAWGLGADGKLVVTGGDVTVFGNAKALLFGANAVTIGANLDVYAGDAAPGNIVPTDTFASSHDQKWVHFAHKHSFTYAVGTGDKANTITATCAANCPDGYSVTLTISAEDVLCNGSAYTGASLDAEAWKAAWLTVPTIMYAGSGSTSYAQSSTAPTEAGDYTASVTVDMDKTASASFIIKDKQNVESVILTQNLTLGIGEANRLDVSFIPADTDRLAVDRTVTWSSKDPEIVTVDASGVVTGVAMGTTTITATATNGTETPDDDKTATCTVKVIEKYPVWVGGEQATEEKLSGNGWSYNATNKTLTLNGYSYEGAGYKSSAIYAEGDLEIVLTGTNSVTGTKDCGIYAMGNLTISGTGSVTASGAKYGLNTKGSFTVNGGAVTAATTATDSTAAIRSSGNVYIKGGNVTATAPARAISSNGNIQISGGTVVATGTGENGWGFGNNKGTFEVTGGDVTVSGNPSALYNNFSYVTIAEGLYVFAGDAAPGINVTGTFANAHDQKWLHIGAHEHSFTYAAGTGDKANTIAATCTAAYCPLDDETDEHKHTVTLTISAENALYNESAYTGASLDTAAWTAAGLAVPTIMYEGRGSTSYAQSAAEPTTPGVYTASVTVNENCTAQADFAIKQKIDVEGVSPMSNLTLAKGETYSLEVSLTPADTDTTTVDRTVTWSSKNPDIATVDANGVVTGMARGTATITATATNGTETPDDDKTATCTVKVIEKYPVWVGGVQVTSEHLSFGDDRHWRYNPDYKILTLKDYSYSGKGYKDSAIYAESNVIIALEGTNSVTSTAAEGESCGIRVTGTLSISGTGSLRASGSKFGIYSYGRFAVNSGTVTATTNDDSKISTAAIRSSSDVQITDGNVTATAPARAISCNGDVYIGGGTVLVRATGTGENAWGFGSNGGLFMVTGGDVTASGEAGVLYNIKSVVIKKGLEVYAGNDEASKEDVTGTFENTHNQKWAHIAPHKHSFTYAAGTGNEANTITATCAAGCPNGYDTSPVTLTIGVPSHTTYGDGKAAAATITDENSIKGDAVVVYYKATKSEDTYTKTGEALSAAPSDAGDYVAEITLGTGDDSATASIGYTIAKAAPVVDHFTYAAPTGLTYDGNPKQATVEGISGTGAVTVKYYSDADCKAEVENPTDAGTYYVGIEVAEGTNYSATSAVLHDASWNFTIAKATPVVDHFTYSAPTGLIYDGNPKQATVEGISGTGAVTAKYYSDADCKAEVENPTDVGTYYVGITVAEGTNYSETSGILHDGTWQFTIIKADQTAPSAPTKASASTHSITLTAIDNGEYSMGDGNSWQESPTFTGLDVNTSYTFRQRLKADDNHNASPESESATIGTNEHTHNWSYAAEGAVITATCADNDHGHGETKTATLTIKAPARTTYGGSGNAEATIAGSIDGVENPSIAYKKGDETLVSAPTDAGAYTASITLGQKTASVSYTIEQKPITITAVDQSVALNGDIDKSIEKVSISSGSLAGGQSLSSVSIAIAEGKNTENAGEYDDAIVPSGAVITDASDEDVTANYAITYQSGKLIVTKIKASVTTAPEPIEGLVYNGQEQALVTKSTADTAVEYALGENADTAPTTGYADAVPSAKDANASYYVWYRAKGDANHEAGDPAVVTATIAKAAIDSVAVSGIDTPTATEDLDTAAATDTAGVTLKNSGAITWNPAALLDGKAEYAETYKAAVTATAAENYTFADNVTATVNGQSAIVSKNPDGTLAISHTFAKTALNPVTIIAADREATYSADGFAIPAEGMFTIPEGAGDVSYAVSNGTGEGTYDAQAGKLTVARCGTFTVKVSTAATNTHEAAEATATLTVNKANNPAAITATVSVMRSGSSPELVNTVDLADNVTLNGATGAVNYVIIGDANGCTLSGSVLTIGSNPGTVTVNVTVEADDNYVALAVTPISVTISDKQTQTITADNVTATYGDTDKRVSASGIDPATGGGAISYAVKNGSEDYIDVDANTGALTVRKAGTAIVIATAAETANYAQATIEVTVTIAKAGISPTLVIQNKTYDGEAISYTITGNPGGGEVASFSWQKKNSDNDWSSVSDTPKDVGTYRGTATIAETDNYQGATTNTVEFTISRAALTVTARPKTITYGDAPANDGVEYSGFVNGETASNLGGTLDYDYSYEQFGNVGNSYTITPKGLTSDNYEITFNTGTLTVGQKEVGLTWSSTSLTYSGTAQAPTAEATGLVDSDTISVTVSGAQTNPGTGYTATASSLTGDKAGNYKLPSANSTTFAIGKAPLTVTANNKTITYGDAPANDGAEYSGFVNSETESVLVGTLGYDYSYTQYGDVGNYTITPKGLTSDNYEISFVAGTLTVMPTEVGLTWDGTSLTFNGSPQAPTATATGTVNGDVISVTVSGGQTNAGTGYTATATGLTGEKADNYQLPNATNTAAFFIEKAAAVTLADVTKSQVYTLTGVSASVAEAMPSNAGELTYEKGTASKTGSVTVSDWNVDSSGTVTATISGGAEGDTITLPVTITSTNYTDSTINVVITLTAKHTQTITASNVTVTYGDTGKSVSATTDGDGTLSYAVKDGDAVTVDASSGALTIVKAGTATVTVTASETSTYAQATRDVTVTVNKAAPTVTAPTAKTLTYTGSEQALVTAGEATGGTMQYALGTATEATGPYTTSIPAKTDAGTYYVWYRVTGDETHLDAPAAGPIEVIVVPPFGTPDFTLPKQLDAIDESAFEGIAASVIDIPASCASIGDRAFRNCTNLTQIRIPAGCALGEDVFDGCARVYVYGVAGSPAEAYCNDPAHGNCVFVSVE